MCHSQDEPPLRLPSISTRKRVVLVRHGQSTWNAEGRIQGSSDFSELTPKGMAQAETTRDMVGGLQHPYLAQKGRVAAAAAAAAAVAAVWAVGFQTMQCAYLTQGKPRLGAPAIDQLRMATLRSRNNSCQ